jgi:hypothetical protein
VTATRQEHRRGRGQRFRNGRTPIVGGYRVQAIAIAPPNGRCWCSAPRNWIGGGGHQACRPQSPKPTRESPRRAGRHGLDGHLRPLPSATPSKSPSALNCSPPHGPRAEDQMRKTRDNDQTPERRAAAARAEARPSRRTLGSAVVVLRGARGVREPRLRRHVAGGPPRSIQRVDLVLAWRVDGTNRKGLRTRGAR